MSVIAWILIIRGCLLLVLWSMPDHMRNYIRHSSFASDLIMAILWTGVGGVVSMVSGAAILKGLNWGRLLYLCHTPIWIVFNGVQFVLFVLHAPPLPIAPGFTTKVILSFILRIAFYIVVFVFLTRPAASAFFAHRNSGGVDV